MPHANPRELPNAGSRWPIAGGHFRSTQWGDMEVGYTEQQHPLDCTELYQSGGLPGGVCQCPHYGYIFDGAIRATYPNTDSPDEVAGAGEVYFFPAGHVLIYPEPTTALELNPAFALQQLMDGIQRAWDKSSSNNQGRGA